MIKLLLEIIPRIIILIALREIIYYLPVVISNNMFQAIQQNPVEITAFLIAFVLFLTALVMPFPIIYIVSLLFLAISMRNLDKLLSAHIFIITGVLAVTDHLKNFYRENQEKFIEINRKSLFLTLLIIVIIMIIITVIPFTINVYLHTFLFPSVHSDSLAGVLIQNPIFILIIILAIGISMYKIVTVIPEILVIYLEKPRKLALDLLRRREDIDVYIVTPFKTIKSMIFSLIFVPPIYGVLSEVILPYLAQTILSRSLFLYDTLIRGIIAISIFIISSYLVYKLQKSIELDVKFLAILSLLSLILIYIGGVIYSIIRRNHVFLEALTQPSITEVLENTASIYLSFYTDMFLFLETLLNLFGATP